MNQIVLKASDLDGYLTDRDKGNIDRLNQEYEKALKSFRELEVSEQVETRKDVMEGLIGLYNDMGKIMQEIDKVKLRFMCTLSRLLRPYTVKLPGSSQSCGMFGRRHRSLSIMYSGHTSFYSILHLGETGKREKITSL